MTRIHRYSSALLALGAFVASAHAETAAPAPAVATAPVAEDGRPLVVKKGTVGIDLCETSPFVFKGRLYRLDGRARNEGKKYLRIVDIETRKEVTLLGENHMFPCVFVEGDTVHVIATDDDPKTGRRRNTINHFTSKDLKTWTKEEIFHNTKMGRICNTTLCKAGDRYVLSVETSESGAWGSRFLETKTLDGAGPWTLLPKEYHGGTPRRLYSPHLLRFHDGWFYLFATVAGHPKGYTLRLSRSHDLKTWENSPYNPVMFAEDADKVPANPDFTEEEKAKIAASRNIDNSDIDFCEFKGDLVIYYCWGNQTGKEFVSEARYSGTMGKYLEGWFPAKPPVAEAKPVLSPAKK